MIILRWFFISLYALAVLMLLPLYLIGLFYTSLFRNWNLLLAISLVTVTGCATSQTGVREGPPRFSTQLRDKEKPVTLEPGRKWLKPLRLIRIRENYYKLERQK
jgi:hypothetical protein